MIVVDQDGRMRQFRQNNFLGLEAISLAVMLDARLAVTEASPVLIDLCDRLDVPLELFVA